MANRCTADGEYGYLSRSAGHEPSDRVASRPSAIHILPGGVEDLDLRLLHSMRTRGHSPGVERAMWALGKAGNYAAIWVALGVLLAIVDGGHREAWLICAALGPVAIGLNFVVKAIVRRRRPELAGLPPLGGAPSSLSFPSAHATSSFAVATAMTRVEPLGALAFALALALALGRPYLGMHYPFDVVAGAILGVALGLLVPLSI
jgi:membrane-associated phospholipid phosphatase